MTLRLGSLFSGIGGLELGFEWAGMQTVWQVESDAYAQRVLAKHWPNVERYEDIKQFDGAKAAKIDVLCGGFPCQPHSSAGLRKASNDERNLWPEFARIIRETKPRWVVAENVRGLLSSEAGRFYGGILKDLADIGYDAEWFMLTAAALGAPHRRERIFIVAYPNGTQREGMGITGRVCTENAPHGGSESGDVANAEGVGWEGSGKFVGSYKKTIDGWFSEFTGSDTGIGASDWWAIEPDVGRVANGIPRRVDRLRCLGNAVVPQCSYEIGKIIMKIEAERRNYDERKLHLA